MPKIETSHTARLAEIQLELDRIDMKSVRAVRAIIAGSGTEEDTQSLDALEKQTKALRAERSMLDLHGA